ncbi:MAG: hypothetical protein ACK5MT_03135 [Actinomycetales bacterium]
MTAQPWINHILNDASQRILDLEQDGESASELRVHPSVARTFERLRAREMSDGMPILVLGAEVVADHSLGICDVSVVP